MSSVPTQDAAYPRGRPEKEPSGPSILPFPDKTRTQAAPPEPLLRFHLYLIVGTIPVHVVGERWRTEDARHCPAPSWPDPSNPAVTLTMRVEAPAEGGAAIRVVSCEEFRALAGAGQAPPARMAGSMARG